jgi:hypothetical protein
VLEITMSPEQQRKAPPIGRVLRVLFGLVLLAYVVPVYFRVPLRVVVGSLVLMLGFIAVYSLIFTSLRLIGSALGSILMHGLIIALYIAGSSRLPILGGGKGQLAAVTFLGISLVIAGMRALPGCELAAIPALFFRVETDVACPIFSPFDKLERKLRRTSGV